MMTIVGVRSNWASVTQQRGKFLRKDLDVKPFKIQLVQELKPNHLPQAEFLLNEFWDSWPKFHFFTEKLRSAAKLISGSMDT